MRLEPHHVEPLPKFFDINCMLGPTNTNREPGFSEAKALLAEMNRMGIAEALVYSSLSRQAHPADGNAHILEAVRGQERLHPCWVVFPPGTTETPPPEELVQQMKAAGVRAARMFPVEHRYPLGRVLYANIDEESKRKILWDNAARILT